MTSSDAAVLIAIAALGAAACGNYSNEDLEYMNAVPDRADLAADLPARSSALAPADEAELARTTHQVTSVFNGMLDNILGLVDTIRSYQPTSRGPQSRTWGPAPADNQPGWRWRLVVTRADAQTFSYALEFQRDADPPDVWLAFLGGSFAASSGLRRGVGDLHVDTGMLRANAFPFDADGAKLQSIDVSYSTRDYPVSVVMDLVTFPDPSVPATTSSAHYEYSADAEGRGAMSFVLTGDLITGPAVETLDVTSRWLPSGAGRADLTVRQGDGAGLHQAECWDNSFNATYNDKPWSAAEDLGDPSACPAAL
jgi:hypothetical protein